MALIKCPHCQNEVSDTLKNCIHCGKPLHESTLPKELGFGERNIYFLEFCRKFPQFYSDSKTKKTLNRLLVSCLCSVFPFLILFICLSISKYGSFDLISDAGFQMLAIPFIIFLALTGVGWIGLLVVFPIVRLLFRRNFLFREKVFQRWLREKKQIDCTLKIDFKANWEKQYYKNLDITKVEL